jgi:drug/metabolite transporter (DMT)-like permease
MNKRFLAIIAVSIATVIYGVNYTIAKEVMPLYTKPYAFIFLRDFGATLIFWFAGLFLKTPKIDKDDYKKIL